MFAAFRANADAYFVLNNRVRKHGEGRRDECRHASFIQNIAPHDSAALKMFNKTEHNGHINSTKPFYTSRLVI